MSIDQGGAVEERIFGFTPSEAERIRQADDRRRELAVACGRRPTFVGVRDGKPVTLKRCRTCGEAKLVTEDASKSEFYLNTPSRPDKPATFKPDCKRCYRTDPGLRARRYEIASKWRKKKREAEPAYFAEYGRMAYHLRKERLGLPPAWRKLKSTALMANDQQARVPTAPLVALIDRLVAARGSEEHVCKLIGIPQRRVFAWRSGESAVADFDAAERVLLHAGLRPDEVWPAEEYPEVAARLGYLEGVS
jgi:hypothetical protein